MADNQKDFIKDGMTNDDIIATLKKIRSVIENKNVNDEIIEKIVNNEMTSEKASVVVGEEWFKKHVNINKNSPPPEKFNRAAKRSKTTDDT